MGMESFILRRLVVMIALLLALNPAAYADVEVNVRQDTITLNDGTEVVCLILMMSPTGVVIVEGDPKDLEKKTQRTIARNTIRNMVIGERSVRTEELFTDIEFAHKVVLRKARKEDAADAENGGGGKASKRTTKAVGKKKETAEPVAVTPQTETTKPAAANPEGGAKPPAPGTVVPEAPVVLPPESLPPKELLDIYIGRYPGLESSVLDVVSVERLQEWLQHVKDGNVGARQPIEGLLNAYVGNVSEAPKTNLPVKSAVPYKSGRYAKPAAEK